jgi:predicted PurR-regulated permease PerM
VAGEVTRTTLAVLAIGGLIIVTLWVLRPFLGALIWATMIVVVTWPLLLRLQAWLGRSRWLAVTTMTLAILLVFVLPFWFAIDAIIEHADVVAQWAGSLRELKIPQPPEFIHRVPLVGAQISDTWHHFASLAPEQLAAKVQPYLLTGVKWAAGEARTIGTLILQILLTLAIVVVLYMNGEAAAGGVSRFGARLAGARGVQAVTLAGQAIRAVALGVVVTALAQAVLGGLGLLVAGVPFAGVLTAVMLVLCLAQIGVLPVLVPAIIWLYWSGENVWGTALLVWTLFVAMIDSFLRPALIRRGADLPLLLILAGVIGGLLAFGLLGIFVGPVVLAVAYRLLEAWVNEADEEPGAPTTDVTHPRAPS